MASEVTIHFLTEQKATVYTTGCGREQKASSKPADITAWSMDLTCPLCITRLFVTHRKVTNLAQTINLDDPTVAKKFHFTGKRFGFRWLINKPVLYVYEEPDGFSPMLALPIQNFVPEIHERGCTYTDAQTTAREWVINHADNFNAPAVQKKRVIQAPPKPKVPAGYTGPLCKSCGKIDEGDFMPHPDSMLDQLCMTCLVAGKR